jgi:hypothetical protein
MEYPPSLALDILARSFRAINGELGLLPADVPAFLDACQADRVRVLGWDLWLVDHAFDAGTKSPKIAPGAWCGLIPLRADPLPAVVAGTGDLAQTRARIAELEFDIMIDPMWLPYIRVNIALDD